MAAKRKSAAGGRAAAAKGGINAKSGSRGAPAASAATSTQGRGRSIGGGAASGATGGSARKNAFGVSKGSSAAMHEPAHTFASSTMPRGGAGNPRRNNPSTIDPDNDGPGDSDATPPGKKAPKKAADTKKKMPTAGNPMAYADSSAPSAPMIRPSRKGAFTAKAKAAGMSTQAYAASVLANTKSHDPATVKQANFARNFGGAAKKGGSK